MGNYCVIKTIIGNLKIVEDHNNITAIKKTDEPVLNPTTTFLEMIASEIEQYFKGTITKFSFPLNPYGTVFQKCVWQELTKIGYGQTKTYGEIAAIINNPKASRAVGRACNKNPILLAIPCHRVVGTNNKLTGFALGLDVKQQLLNLEQKK